MRCGGTKPHVDSEGEYAGGGNETLPWSPLTGTFMQCVWFMR
jgi:hypothetical protein